MEEPKSGLAKWLTKGVVWKLAVAVAVVIVGVAGIAIAYSNSSSSHQLQEQLVLGNQYLEDMDYEQAIAAFETALEIDDKCVEAYLGLARAYTELGDIEQAIEILNAGIELTGSEELRALLEELQDMLGEETEPEDEVETEQIAQTEETGEVAEEMEMAEEEEAEEEEAEETEGLPRRTEEQEETGTPEQVVSNTPEETPYIPEEIPFIPEEETPEEIPSVPEEDNQTGSMVIGSVAEAANHTNYIPGATIEIYDSATTQLFQTVYSDETGNYQVSLIPGNYVLQVLVNGYIPVIDNITVADGILYLEPHLMILGAAGAPETGRISGYITNAVNGLGTAGISLTARNGWNCISGDAVGTAVTDANGYYEMELPLGYYTILMEGAGCVANHFNVAVTPGIQENTNATINPTNESQFPAGEMRVVLTWGATPRDLDSHLVGPTMDGAGRFHIYFGNKNLYENGSVSAFLDVDDTSSYGPETVTVYQMNSSGIYSYYVHDYTNGYNSGSYGLANSEAQVSVYFGDVLYANYHVPASIPGTVWHVFDLDAATRTITPVNVFEERISYGSRGMKGEIDEPGSEDGAEVMIESESVTEDDGQSLLSAETSGTTEAAVIVNEEGAAEEIGVAEETGTTGEVEEGETGAVEETEAVEETGTAGETEEVGEVEEGETEEVEEGEEGEEGETEEVGEIEEGETGAAEETGAEGEIEEVEEAEGSEENSIPVDMSLPVDMGLPVEREVDDGELPE